MASRSSPPRVSSPLPASPSEKVSSPPAPPPSPADAAPTAYLVKVGEYDQMVPAALFAPWFAALCAQVGTDHAALSAEVSRRLGLA